MHPSLWLQVKSNLNVNLFQSAAKLGTISLIKMLISGLEMFYAIIAMLIFISNLFACGVWFGARGFPHNFFTFKLCTG